MKKWKIKKLNNNGSALILAVVIVGFITILTSILLYLATTNFQMKATDYNTKVSFYGAETPLEEIRTQLALDMQAATEDAYMHVLLNYCNTGSGGVRLAEYQNNFYDQLKAIWNARTTDPTGATGNWVYGIDNMLKTNPLNPSLSADYHVINEVDWSATTGSCATTGCTAKYHIILNDLAGAERLVYDETEGKVLLKGITVIYTEGSYSSVISTDFCVGVPGFDWDVEGYAPTWDDELSSERTTINFEQDVTYMNWTKH